MAQRAKFEESDAGRSVAGIQDSGDCTVRALAHAAGVPYEKAHRVLKAHGRKDGSGLPFRKFIRAFTGSTIFGKRIWIVGLPVTKITFGQFAKRTPKGNFILKTEGHVAAVVDGVLKDSFDSRGKKLTMAWKLT